VSPSGNAKHALKPGASVRIIKQRPDGSEAATYPGAIVPAPPGWVAARAVWEFQRMDLGYMLFEPGDYLLEYFSLSDPFNAFALYSEASAFKGWYCNVTHPTTVRGNSIYWHDLFVDVIVQPDGRILVLDEDELADSGLKYSDPPLYRLILDAKRRILRRVRNGDYPFSENDPIRR
jgi:uncharacterized protein